MLMQQYLIIDIIDDIQPRVSLSSENGLALWQNH